MKSVSPQLIEVGEKIIIDKNYVTKNLGELAKDMIYQSLFYKFFIIF